MNNNLKKRVQMEIGEAISLKQKLAALCWGIAASSFFGFCFESVFVAITLQYIDNRNMVLPFLLGYGLAIAVIYLVFGTPRSPRFFGLRFGAKNLLLRLFYYFAVVFLCVSAGELSVGLFVEGVCNVTWWDYSGIPLHFTKFTSVPTSAGFAALMMLFIQFLFEPLYFSFLKLNKKVLYSLAVIFMLFLFADCIYSGIRMYLTNDFMILWRIDF